MNLFIVVILLAGVVVTLCEEDQCNRFDCEYKMMRKIVQLENEQEILKKYVGQGGSRPEPNNSDLAVKVRQLEEDNTELRSSLRTVNSHVQVLQQQAARRSESTYVRWGHTECPTNGTMLLYSGYMGGTIYSQASGPQNPQCLPKNPDWGHYDSSVQPGGKIYGAEYRFGGHSDLAKSFFNKSTRGYDVPCAVCLTSRSPVLMVPGKNHCMAGWTTEYDGYLASTYDGDEIKTSVDFFCLDRDPQFVTGSVEEIDGILVHLVESICGPLPCPPYHNGRELTCVVCSK